MLAVRVGTCPNHRALFSALPKQHSTFSLTSTLHARRWLHRKRISTPQSSAEGLKPLPWTGSAQQQQALETLQHNLARRGLPVATEVIQWYLRDRYFDVREAEDKLVKTLAWRRSLLPHGVERTAVGRELATGKAYVHTHCDVYGRPALVVRASKHLIGQFPLDDSKRLCVFLMEEALQQLPPRQEQLVGIIDLTGFGVRNADVLFAKFMVEAFFEHYPRRVGEVLLVDAPWMFSPLYETIRPLLRKYSALVTFVTKEQLRQRYFAAGAAPADFT